MNSTIAMRRIAELDLEPIKTKLMHQQSGEGWSAARADAAEREYRRFLCMMLLHPQENFAPLFDVDMFWHYHILDTRQYAADCEQAFGFFLHHNPAVGLGDTADDVAEHAALGERMHALYAATFGEPCPANAPSATAWCSLNAGEAKPATAWCSLNASEKKVATAWCSIAAAMPRTAWCSVAANDAQMDVAWCSSPSAGAAPKTAWCSLTRKSAAKEAATV